jgi:hypothetical protein
MSLSRQEDLGFMHGMWHRSFIMSSTKFEREEDKKHISE